MKSTPIIDYTELRSNDTPGAGLEALVRLLGMSLELTTDWAGAGTDGGKDLIFTDLEKGKIGARPFKWLVQCKDNSVSGASVSESDFRGSFTDKIRQHKCDGYLLVTTTRVTAGLKDLLDGIDGEDNRERYRTKVWEHHELTQMLLDPKNEALLMQFFPKGYDKLMLRKQKLQESYRSLKSKAQDNFGLQNYNSTREGAWTNVKTTDLSMVGLSIELSFPQFDSGLSTDFAEINLLLRADALQTIHSVRKEQRGQPVLTISEPDSDGHGLVNAIDDSMYVSNFEVAMLSHKILSIVYHATTYGAGAAHPNHTDKTFNFELLPIFPITLDTIFQNQDDLAYLSRVCRNALFRKFRQDLDWSPELEIDDLSGLVRVTELDATSDERPIDNVHLLKGTEPTNENFNSFYLTELGLVFIFKEYQVSDYAAGAQRVLIPYNLIADRLSRDSVVFAAFVKNDETLLAG